MYTPSFPYKGNQAIISSDRVQLISKGDSIILFGDKSIILSTPESVHINSNTSVLIDSPRIELGGDANILGQPVLLGYDFIKEMSLFLKRLEDIADGFENVGQTNLAASMSNIRQIGNKLNSAVDDFNRKIAINSNLESRVLSKITYTR